MAEGERRWRSTEEWQFSGRRQVGEDVGGEGRVMVIVNVEIAAARVKYDAVSFFSLYHSFYRPCGGGGGNK